MAVTERITIIVDERGSRVVQGGLRGIGDTARGSAGGVQFLQRALAAIGITAGLRELLRTLDTFTQLENRLRSTGIEGQNLTGVYQALLKASNDTRSSVQGSVELYSRLALSSRELGVSQSQLIDFTKSLNQAIILSGASATEAEAGLIQLSQGMASGTLRGDELRSVLEQLPAVADVIAKQLGVTRGQLREMGQDGKITADIILDAFKNARVELDERFGKTVPTLGQSMQVLKNNFVNAMGEFDKATGISTALSRALLFVAENIETILKVVVGLGAGWAIVAGGAAAFNAVRNAVILLNAAIAANPIGFLLTLLTSAISLLTLFRDQIKLGTNETTTLGDLFRAVGEKIGAALKFIWEQARAVFGPLIALIEEWVGKVDFSIAGVLKLVAKGVDLYYGAWFGAIGAVITLFRGFGPAVSDLMTQALNVLLKKIGGFVNSAGELLSNITEFAGLGKIAAVDLQLTNENAGAAQNLGKEVGDAFRIGLQNSTAQDFVQGLFDRADEIGKARSAAEAAAGGTVNGVAPPKVNLPGSGDDDDKKKKRDLAEELKNLISQYDGVYAAQQEYLAAQKLLNAAEAAGLITAERKAQVLGLIKDQLRDQLDPLGAVNRELDEQQRLLKLTADAREVETQVLTIEKDLRSQGLQVTQEEINKLRERIALIQEETKAAQARQQVLDAIKGPQEEFTRQIQAINDLLAAGTITQQQANAFLVQSNTDLLAGTIEAQDALVVKYEETYARINEMRQADLISEQTAAMLKRRADIEQVEGRLANARTFFSTLSGLSRSENRKLAAIGKAAAVAQATIDGVLAVQKALASSPPPANYVLAAATGAVAAVNVAQIISQPLPGYAFGGNFKVGGTGGTDSQVVAFRATPDERVRVTTPAQEREEQRQAEGAQGQGSSVRILNVLDPGLLKDYLDSPDGDETIVNAISRNSGRIAPIINNRVS